MVGVQFCLGSLLLSLYIYDISTDIDSEIRLFADDCVCYREIKDTECTLKLQKDIAETSLFMGNRTPNVIQKGFRTLTFLYICPHFVSRKSFYDRSDGLLHN